MTLRVPTAYELASFASGGGASDLSDPAVTAPLGFITLKQFNAVGQETAPVDFTNPAVPVLVGTPFNNKAAVRAAVLYANANGIRTILLSSAHYAWHRDVSIAADLNIHDHFSGLCISNAAIEFKSIHPSGRSTITRLSSTGTVMTLADYETHSGFVWRGGGVGMRSTTTAAGEDPALKSFTSDGVLFDGGLRKIMGMIFNIGDKGLWFYNDRNAGHMTFRNGGGFIGWDGEVVYGSGTSPIERARRIWDIGPGCKFGESGATGLNPNGETLMIHGFPLMYNCFGFEGWTGGYGNLVELEARDCPGGITIQSGTVNVDGARGGYYKFTNPLTGGDEACWGTLRLKLLRAGADLGCYLNFDIEAIDCSVNISDGAAFASGSQHIRGHLRSTVDGAGLTAALFLGGANLASAFIKVDLFRSDVAVANARVHTYATTGGGNFGGNVTIDLGQNYGRAIFTNIAACTGMPIKFVGNVPLNAGGGVRHNMDTTATFDFKGTGPDISINFSTGAPAARTYYVALPVDANVEKGTRRSFYNLTKNDIAGGGILRILGSYFGQGRDVLLGPGYTGGLEVEYAGNNSWHLATAPRKPAFSTAYDPPSLALTASSAIQTLATAYGVLPGDKVEGTWAVSRPGQRISAECSVADTISFYVTNENGANPTDSASATIIFEVS